MDKPWNFQWLMTTFVGPITFLTTVRIVSAKAHVVADGIIVTAERRHIFTSLVW